MLLILEQIPEKDVREHPGQAVERFCTERIIREETVNPAEDKDVESLEESLEGYKGKIMPVNKGTLTWDKDLIFLGRTQRGYEIDFDAQAQWGCIPTESLLMSVAGCLAIDVVSFLQKMKAVISSLKIDISGERNPTPPQYYTSIEMVIHISGENITPKKMERVVSLSQEKYCSVYHSLRKDVKVRVKYVINEGSPVPPGHPRAHE